MRNANNTEDNNELQRCEAAADDESAGWVRSDDRDANNALCVTK
jgi:hypothetical protein